VGALTFFVLDAANPLHFGVVWGLVFAGSLLATCVGTWMRVRERGEKVWSRQARAVLLALAPSIFAAVVLSVFFFRQGLHLWLPGAWMLCYAQGALATAVYAPVQIRQMGVGVLVLACVTFLLGTGWAVLMMGLVFGLGHVWMGLALLAAERREAGLRLYRSVA
jgi:hypothetical protein